MTRHCFDSSVCAVFTVQPLPASVAVLLSLTAAYSASTLLHMWVKIVWMRKMGILEWLWVQTLWLKKCRFTKLRSYLLLTKSSAQSIQVAASSADRQIHQLKWPTSVVVGHVWYAMLVLCKLVSVLNQRSFVREEALFCDNTVKWRVGLSVSVVQIQQSDTSSL